MASAALQADIRSCALVSPAFTAAAQRHLFCDINLVRHSDRLFAILAAAPHLLPFVRRVLTYLEPNVLARLVEFSFPNLSKLYLMGADKVSPTRSELSLAANLVGLPSIRAVTLTSIVFQTISDLNLLFETHTSQLDTLILDHSDVLDAGTVPSPPMRRVKLKKLTLCLHSIAWPRLLHPDCPFDISALRELEYDSMELFATPATLLTSTRSSLTALSISPIAFASYGASTVCITVTDLPALTHLTVMHFHGAKWPGLAPQLQSNSVTLLTLMYTESFDLRDANNLRANISVQIFPKLQTVEINVSARFRGQVRSLRELQTEVRAALTGWDLEEKVRVVLR
ncbi:hypothetical protein C8R46DRAFT_1201673 [Mycena filopes]|nr:hypothetical protein C8R46DRAFT_1201673 [Mycena filopes]